MAISSAIVLFMVTWFMVLFVVLPIGLRTQGDEGEKVAGTHESSPANFQLKRTLRRVTLYALLVWAPLVAIIASGVISVSDIDIGGRMPSHH